MKKSQIIVVISLVLSIIAIFISIYAISINNNIDETEKRSEKFYKATIKENTKMEEIEKLVEKIENTSGVISVRIITKEEAASTIKNNFSNVVEQLDENKFNDSIIIGVSGTEKEFNNMQRLLENDSIVKEIRKDR